MNLQSCSILLSIFFKHQKYLLVTGKNAKHGLGRLTTALERFDKKFAVYYRISYPLLWSERGNALSSHTVTHAYTRNQKCHFQTRKKLSQQNCTCATRFCLARTPLIRGQFHRRVASSDASRRSVSIFSDFAPHTPDRHTWK